MDKPLRLETLAQFLAFLEAMPPVESTCSALIRGPLSVFGARAGFLMVVHEHVELRIISHYGHTDKEVRRFSEVSLDLDLPPVRAFRDGAISSFDPRSAPEDFPAIALDPAMWTNLVGRLNASTLICVPVSHAGAGIGVFTFVVDQGLAWQDVDHAYLQILSGVLAMWLTHPRNGLRESAGLNVVDEDAPLVLSQRQRHILRLVQEGCRNDQIAARLGFSVSTVKAEIQAINRVLRTSDRTSAVSRAVELKLLST